MRPDMLLVEKSCSLSDYSDGTRPSLHDLEQLQHKRSCRISVVEQEFCMGYLMPSNTKNSITLCSSSQQCWICAYVTGAHMFLQADVQLHLLICGSTCTGGMFKLAALHLTRLGISNSTVDILLQDLHWKALRRLEQIVGTRRRLEHTGSQYDAQMMRLNQSANNRKHRT